VGGGYNQKTLLEKSRDSEISLKKKEKKLPLSKGAQPQNTQRNSFLFGGRLNVEKTFGLEDRALNKQRMKGGGISSRKGTR